MKRPLSAFWKPTGCLKIPSREQPYDARHLSRRQLRWKIFDQHRSATGVGAEKRKRHGILSLLYTNRINSHDAPYMTIHELEELLGCPRDHLQVSLWYLKEKNYVQRSDSGRYSITVEGVDQMESGGMLDSGKGAASIFRQLSPAPEPTRTTKTGLAEGSPFPSSTCLGRSGSWQWINMKAPPAPRKGINKELCRGTSSDLWRVILVRKST